MSSICFWDTPKAHLSHYLFIFSNMEPLGAELKNPVCSRLGTMLYLDIQKGNYAMKSFYYTQDIGGSAA